MMNYSKIFMEQNEQFICALGNSYLKKFLTDNVVKKGFAVVSDKRVYFKGECLSAKGAKFKKSWEERVVDTKDITGTGYKRVSIFNALIATLVSFPFVSIFFFYLMVVVDPTISLSFLLFSFGCPLVINLLLFKCMRRNVFTISFPGGIIAFDAYWYDKSEVDEFQRLMRLAKDSAHRVQATPPAAPSAATRQSFGTADELQKLAALLAQGAITQEEYNKLKADMIR